MAIKFLRDHKVDGDPVEEFTAGQVVDDRSPESEMHFVRRRHAAFIRDGKLYDHEGREVTEPAALPAKASAGGRRARERTGVARAVTGERPKAAPKPRARKPAPKKK